MSFFRKLRRNQNRKQETSTGRLTMESLEPRVLLSLSVTGMNPLTAMELAQNLAESQGEVTEASYTGLDLALGTFTGGFSEGIGIDSGVILTTGKAGFAAGPNNSDRASQNNESPGDDDLGNLFDAQTYDAAVLEFYIDPWGDTLSFQYVFASEEYNENAGTSQNDAFGLFVNGENIAFIPYSTYPISVGNVNQEWNSEYFVNNDYGDHEENPPYSIQYDGFTVSLLATAQVSEGYSVHVKMVIADSGDRFGDSAVFLAGFSEEQPAEADVSLTKTASVDTVLPGESFDYTITATNTSSTDSATDVTITDTLPAGIFYLDSSVPQGTAEFNNGTLTANVGTLEPGASVTLTITAFGSMSGWYTNTATVSAMEPDPDPENNASSDDVYVLFLSEIEGTVWFDANGDGTRDEGEPGMGGVSVYLDLNQNDTWEDNEPMTVTSSDDSETEADEEGLYSFYELYPGDYAVKAVLPAGYSLTQSPEPFTLGAEEWATEKDFGMAMPQADVSLTKTASAETILPGESFIYTLTAENMGSMVATGVTITDTLPAGIFYLESSVPQGTAEFIDGTFTANLGTLEPGQSVTLTITAYAGMSGWHINTATVSANEFDPNPWNNAYAYAFYVPYAISGLEGTVWYDTDGNGTRDEGEPGMAGVEVYLDLNQNNEWEYNEPMTVTSSDDSETEDVNEEGRYSFYELYPGDYAVKAVLPAGYSLTREPEPFTLGAEEWATGKDFGMAYMQYATSAIEGTVWYDLDGDGMQDEGEPGMAGVEVYLDLNQNNEWEDNEPMAVTSSDDSGEGEAGRYSFYELYPGEYMVRAILPTGYWLTQSPGAFSLGEEEWATGKDFGMTDMQYAISAIEGTVWNDTDGDGTRDEGEAGMAGVKVYLDMNQNGKLDGEEPWTLTESGYPGSQTNEAGRYFFYELYPGEYTVRAILPTGYSQTRAPGRFSLGVEEWATGKNFGMTIALAKIDSIAGTVFCDLNGNGIQDSGGTTPETGMAGVTVYLDLNKDGVLSGGEPSTTSTASGGYAFVGLTPGATYVVRESVPFGYKQTAGTYTVTLDVNPLNSLHFGNQPVTTELSGTVFVDANGNGARDGGSAESGMAGVTVYLDTNNNGVLDSGERSTATGAGGSYAFTELTPGMSCVVREMVPAGHQQTLGTYEVTLGVEPLTNLDFGNQPLTTELSGVIYLDANGNGTRDGSGEAGMAGITVYLDANNNGVLDGGERTSVAGADGRYQFMELTPKGTYTVREVVPAGYLQTSGPYTVTLGAAAAENLNFGNRPKATSVSGLKFLDANGNGILDGGLIVGPQPDVVFMIDISGSTILDFEGTPVGDLNDDGKSNTILDAQIAGFIALNQQLINQGFGITSKVAIVAFETVAANLDMDPSTPGNQLYTYPSADNDDDGILDVAEALASLSPTGGTNYEAALQAAMAALTGMETTAGNGNVIFLSDGYPNSVNYLDDMAALRATGAANIRAFGVGMSANLDALADIDPNGAEIFTNTDELLDVFSGAGENGGISSYSETNLAGVRIYADLNHNSMLDDNEPWTLTDADGNYTIGGLTAGATYTIREVVPAGYIQTSGPYTLVLGVDESENLDFGNQPDGLTIAGVEFYDANGNGAYDSGTEAGMPGVTIYLDLNNNGYLDGGEPSTEAGANGSFAFTDLTFGYTYAVREIVPEGYVQTAGPYSVQVGIGATTNLKIGNAQEADETPEADTIAGIAFEDADSNGISEGEAGLGGVTVYLDLNQNGALDANEPMRITAPDGSYSFTGLTAGQVYTVREITPSGYQQTSGPYTVNAGDGAMNLHFGNSAITGEHPSLAAKSLAFTGHTIVVPGDTIDLSFVFANEGNVTAEGPVNVFFYASADDVLDGGDMQIGSFLNRMVSLAAGEESDSFELKGYTIPADLLPGNVILFAMVEPADGSIQDDLAINNAVSTMMDVRWRFGSWDEDGDGKPDRKNVSLSVSDADGTISKFTMKSGGYGELDGPSFNLLSLYDTSLKSKVAIKTSGGSVAGIVIQNITADGDVGSFQAGSTSLGNSFTAAGAVSKLLLNDVAAANKQISMNLGASLDAMKKGCSLKFHQIQNLDFNSLSPIDSFVFAEWLDSGSADTLFAPSVKTLLSKGDSKNDIDGHFEADVMLTDSNSLLSKLTVNGLMNGSSVRTPGSIDTVKLGASLDSSIFAGILSGVSSLPSSPDQISNPSASIGTLVIGGSKTIGDFLGSADAHSFENTLIGANEIGSLSLTGVRRENGELEHGVAANAIESLKVKQPDGYSYVWDSGTNTWKTQPADGWQDFDVNILE